MNIYNILYAMNTGEATPGTSPAEYFLGMNLYEKTQEGKKTDASAIRSEQSKE